MRDSSIRLALPSDLEPSARLREALWPESSAEEHLRELTLILADQFPRMMPLVIFVCRASDETLVGFIEVGLRSQLTAAMNPVRWAMWKDGMSPTPTAVGESAAISCGQRRIGLACGYLGSGRRARGFPADVRQLVFG